MQKCSHFHRKAMEGRHLKHHTTNLGASVLIGAGSHLVQNMIYAKPAVLEVQSDGAAAGEIPAEMSPPPHQPVLPVTGSKPQDQKLLLNKQTGWLLQ